MSATTLILGAAIGYSADQLRPFLGSLARVGYRGDLCLLVGDLDRETAGLLERAHATAKRFAPERFPGIVVHASRYFGYLEALEETASYRHVLLTDTRDVVFQSDPFQALPEGSLFAFLEDRRRSIGSCEANAGWIRAAFGEPTLSELADRSIICSGVTLGTGAGIRDYLVRLTGLFAQVDPDALSRIGIDQGIHNVLLHRRLIEARLVPNGELVAHLGYVPLEEIRLADGPIIANVDGSYCSIVHQYDRWLTLDEVIRARYQAFPEPEGR
jgi:hypothetical protein